MTDKKVLVFDDRVSFYGKRDFVDYPTVKIRSYDQQGSNIKTLMIFVYGLLSASGIFYLITQ